MSNNNPVSILGANGKPLAPLKPLGLAGNNTLPYDAADMYGQHTEAWMPYLWSVDGQNNPYRDIVVSRARDLVRNDGWASGIIQRVLDNAIGSNFRPIAKPDYQALAATTGNKAFDAVWADEFGKAADAYWRNWAGDINHYCHSQRKLSFTEMMGLAFRHKLIDGDALGVMKWLPDRVGPGKASYATAVQIIDPDRLSNPQVQFDQQLMRGGVEVDSEDVAVAYWIRRAHQGDWFSASLSMTWDRIERETSWGRPVVVHDYDSDRAQQHRGGGGILTPIIQRIKMLYKYDGSALDAAIIGALFGSFITSPYDQQLVEDALGDGDQLNTYQAGRAEFHKDRNIILGNAKIPQLFPGEDLKTTAPNNPNNNFEAFESAFLRNMAAATGLSAMQVHNDWSDVNYSSARAAMLEAWKTLLPRRTRFANGFAAPIRSAFMEESMEIDDYPMPRNAPSFQEFRTQYARCMWVGPGKGVVDVTK
ncbi:MAG: phage portal protein [Methylococcales bacterium]